jgi:hypothetical protein
MAAAERFAQQLHQSRLAALEMMKDASHNQREMWRTAVARGLGQRWRRNARERAERDRAAQVRARALCACLSWALPACLPAACRRALPGPSHARRPPTTSAVRWAVSPTGLSAVGCRCHLQATLTLTLEPGDTCGRPLSNPPLPEVTTERDPPVSAAALISSADSHASAHPTQLLVISDPRSLAAMAEAAERRRAEVQQLLYRFRGFASASPSSLARLSSHLSRHQLGAGTRLCVQGQPSTHHFLVLRGRLRLTRRRPDGQETVLTTLGAGATLGAFPAATAAGDGGGAVGAGVGCWPASAQASGECEVLRVQRYHLALTMAGQGLRLGGGGADPSSVGVLGATDDEQQPSSHSSSSSSSSSPRAYGGSRSPRRLAPPPIGRPSTEAAMAAADARMRGMGLSTGSALGVRIERPEDRAKLRQLKRRMRPSSDGMHHRTGGGAAAAVAATAPAVTPRVTTSFVPASASSLVPSYQRLPALRSARSAC